MISRRQMILASVAATCPSAAWPQASSPGDYSIQVGDHWTYDRKNEITGIVEETYTSTVTEISPQEIVTSVRREGKDESSVVVFDHDWNRVINGAWRYKPNDAHGIRPPLQVGKEWRSEFNEANTLTSAKRKASSLAKISGQETITTPAGTFATFKIERQVKTFNIAAPSVLIEAQFVLWYAPEIDHWVRRAILTKVERRTNTNSTETLIAFGRKN